MPYKDYKMRYAVTKRWREKNKDRYMLMQKARQAANIAYPIPQQCSVDGCEEMGERHHDDYAKPLEIRWLCRDHHEAEHHKAICTVSGCAEKHLAKGYCKRHYYILYRRRNNG